MGHKHALVKMLFLVPTLTWAEVPALDACKVITASDVKAAVGDGFEPVANPLAGKMGSEYSTCLYQKDRASTAAIFILRNPGGPAKANVLGRQEAQRRAGRTVTAIPGLCDAAFSIVLTPQKTNVVAAKGIWQVETEVIVGGKPEAAAAQKLAGVACSRLP